jgi:hypothetical protein
MFVALIYRATTREDSCEAYKRDLSGGRSTWHTSLLYIGPSVHIHSVYSRFRQSENTLTRVAQLADYSALNKSNTKRAFGYFGPTKLTISRPFESI